MKKDRFADVTKDELIEYFFNPLSGGFKLGADKERFFIWLERKRTGLLISAYESAADVSQKALSEYVDCLKQARGEPDADKKLEWFDKANRAWARYEAAEKQVRHASAKVDRALGIGGA